MAGILVEAFADGWVRPNASPEFGFPSGDFAYGLGLFLTTVAAVLQAVIGLGAVGLARLVFNRFAPRAS
jgi:hypothetical protein